MQYIVFTLPYFYKEEADAITQMFQSGLRRLHLRKPGSKLKDCRKLLANIPECYHRYIVVHDHHELLGEYALAGVHLNSRNPELKLPCTQGVEVSVSCHSVAELAQRKRDGFTYPDGTHGDFAYLSLSPIFDSISKQGYNAAFTAEELRQAHSDGVIDERVMALGGICNDNIEEALQYGFGGVMVLGDAWKNVTKNKKRDGNLPIVLTIAGSDTSAGAGVQQDLKTITNFGCYAATVITALTSQNTMGVKSVMPVPADVVESQLKAVFSDLDVAAVKIGMVPNAEVAEVIIRVLRAETSKRVLPIVLDPVMISTSGARLMSEDCISLIVNELFPLCTLVTPNLPEKDCIYDAKGLLSQDNRAAFTLQTSLLCKGGHAEGENMSDTLYIYKEYTKIMFVSPRILTKNLHGTGCTLSSAIASGLAKGQSLRTAVGFAKDYMDKAIEGGRELRIGHGNGPLWFGPENKS